MVARTLAVLGAVLSLAAGAATLQLEPVSIRLTPAARSAVMQLRNGGAEPMNVQVRAFRWSQADGEDRLLPTGELRVSPPIQMIAPGGEQFVRLLLDEQAAPAAEETYRLIIDELPRTPTPGGQVRMLIRYSVPVVVRPEGLAPPQLQFRLLHEPDGPVLEALNTGGQGARLADLELTTSAGERIPVASGLFGYVLAGQARRWPLALSPAAVEGVTGITAQVDGTAGHYALAATR